MAPYTQARVRRAFELLRGLSDAEADAYTAKRLWKRLRERGVVKRTPTNNGLTLEDRGRSWSGHRDRYGRRRSDPLVAPVFTKTTTALVAIHRRPAMLLVDGWWVDVRARDKWHAVERRWWRQLRRSAHPDLGGSTAEFVTVSAKYARWLVAERAWYEAHGGLALPSLSVS